MTTVPSCPREPEVLELAMLGHWPALADPALREHAADCAVCRDLARVTVALSDWRDEAGIAVRVPDASRIWRAAERRARAEATRRATRPVLAVEIVSAAVAALVAVTWGPGLWAVATQAWGPVSWARWLPLGQAFPVLAELSSPVRWSLLTLAGWAVLVTVAFSLAGLADRWPHDRRQSGPAR